MPVLCARLRIALETSILHSVSLSYYIFYFVFQIVAKGHYNFGLPAWPDLALWPPIRQRTDYSVRLHLHHSQHFARDVHFCLPLPSQRKGNFHAIQTLNILISCLSLLS